MSSFLMNMTYLPNFELFIFVLFIDQKPAKMAIFAIFESLRCYQWQKFKKCPFIKSFAFLKGTFVQTFKWNCQEVKEEEPFEGYLLKFWSKHCISGPFFALMADLRMPIKSELLRVRKAVSTFENRKDRSMTYGQQF